MRLGLSAEDYVHFNDSNVPDPDRWSFAINIQCQIPRFATRAERERVKYVSSFWDLLSRKAGNAWMLERRQTVEHSVGPLFLLHVTRRDRGSLPVLRLSFLSLMSVFKFQADFDVLIKSLDSQPATQESLDRLVEKALEDTKGKASPENQKSIWEYLLKNEILKFAVCVSSYSWESQIQSVQCKEGQALKTKDLVYYDKLRHRLDLALTFTEHGWFVS